MMMINLCSTMLPMDHLFSLTLELSSEATVITIIIITKFPTVIDAHNRTMMMTYKYQ